jgi:hypothetical protein
VSSNDSPVMRNTVMQDQDAPPIPPRKNATNDFTRPLKPQLAPPPPEKIEPAPEPPKPKKNFINESFDDDEEDPICGPAETITGEDIVLL